MAKITPCLWFDGKAEEAANFYVTVFPRSRVDSIRHAASDYPSGKAGDVLTWLGEGPIRRFLADRAAPADQVVRRSRSSPQGAGVRGDDEDEAHRYRGDRACRRWRRRMMLSDLTSPRQMRPGRRVVTSWTSHALPSGSAKAKNDP
jgi:hypothetical protein